MKTSSMVIWDQSEQMVEFVWDGDLISKVARDWLVLHGLAMKTHGWNVLIVPLKKVAKALVEFGLDN